MISGFRSADGRRIGQQNQRRVSWREREDGMIELQARLPKEDAAVLLAAIEGAKDQSGHQHRNPTRAVIKRSRNRCRVSGCTAAQTRCWMWPGCS
jgi:hypothetical protein